MLRTVTMTCSAVSMTAALYTLLLLTTCTPEREFTSRLHSGIVETEKYYDVTGLGAASPGETTSEARAKVDAETRAYFQAVDMLVETVQGVAVRGEAGMRDLTIPDGELLQLLRARLKGIKKLDTRYEQQEDGSWMAAVTIRYDKESAGNLLGEIAGTYTPRTGHNENGSFSGVILDLRAVYGYTSLLALRVVSRDGRDLFSIRDIDPDILTENYGIPVFSTLSGLMNTAAGSLPLRLVPVEYDDGVVVLSNSDTRKLLDCEDRDTLIKQGKIAIIL